ncbi:MAG: hypothetical protein QF831_01425, partial [Candidatus Thalassarchaeaceae archaeon]|nr:hypothetical protein [Candidatus Thalassarchaeaceae archaeon]
PVEGCTNSSATNYNPLAEIDNGTCEYNNPSPNNNSNNNTGNQTGNQTGNNTSNNTSNNTGSNQTGETPDEEEMVTCDACCGETVEVSVSIGCNAIDSLDCDPCNPVENNQDSTTETGEVASGSLVVYALLIILVLAIIGFVMMSIRRP